jgi:membrane-bound lytic murein transglycosylase
MRYKAVFIAGAAAGFVAGTRAGRDVYDKMVAYGQQVVAHPKVQQARSTAQAKATDLAKQAAAKAPDYAKNAANTAAKTAQAQVSQVPKYVSSAKQAATSKLPRPRLGGKNGATDTNPVVEDNVDQDGNLVYPAEGSPSQVNSVRSHYTPDTP